MRFQRSLKTIATWLRSTTPITISAEFHQTLRITPAMEAGLTDHIWSLEELVSLLWCNEPAKTA